MISCSVVEFSPPNKILRKRVSDENYLTLLASLHEELEQVR